MLIQIGFLGEAEIAAWVLAMVWLLVGVDPQVVEEVVPLPEDFAAILVLALQKSDDSSGVRTPIFENHVILGIWDVFLDSNLLEVELLTVPNDNELVLLNRLVVLEMLFEIEVEFGLDLLHGVQRVFDPHHLGRFRALLVL